MISGDVGWDRLLVAEKQFRRITGYRQTPVLIKELKVLTPPKAAVVKRKKAP